MEKFPQAHDLLVSESAAIEITPVVPAPMRQLLRIHTSGYLRKLAQGTLTDQEVCKLGLPWQPRLLHRSSLETAATVAACRHALDHGMAANLAGGTHHAFPDRGLGYCVLNDVAVAVRDLQAKHPSLRVFIADTDAHQGNGTHAIFRGDRRVFTYSIHGERNYPSAKEAGNRDVGLPRQVSGDDYLIALSNTLPPSLDSFPADLVIWISGADVHERDRFGQMKLTTEHMTERDRRVIDWCLDRRLPLVILYGGGYHREPGMTARLHANTISTAAMAFRAIQGSNDRRARQPDLPGKYQPGVPSLRTPPRNVNPEFPILELVVARHVEDLAWLGRVPENFQITVYDKGDGSSGGIRLPNQGREAHTYLHHLTERHESLAALTVFVQGHPFDHAPDLHKTLRALAEGTLTINDFYWLGFLADTDDSRGRRLFVPWSKNPDRHELQLHGFHQELFGAPGPADYRFFVGAQFAVPRAAIRYRPADFYRRARALAAGFPLAPHCFERCWDRVFRSDGTAGRMPPGQPTAYFKPIKRLNPSGTSPTNPASEAGSPPSPLPV